MAVEYFFSGNAIGAVCADGRVRLPNFVRGALERRSRARTLLFGAHEADPCLTGCDAGHLHFIHVDIERRRLRDEAEGVSPEVHSARVRQAFGLVEEANFDEEGFIVLPPMMRRRGGIEDLALFVGTGDSFEIWNPQRARGAGDEGLRELAEYRLGESIN